MIDENNQQAQFLLLINLGNFFLNRELEIKYLFISLII